MIQENFVSILKWIYRGCPNMLPQFFTITPRTERARIENQASYEKFRKFFTNGLNYLYVLFFHTWFSFALESNYLIIFISTIEDYFIVILLINSSTKMFIWLTKIRRRNGQLVDQFVDWLTIRRANNPLISAVFWFLDRTLLLSILQLVGNFVDKIIIMEY